MVKDKTVISSPPISVTAHNGIESQKPTLLMASINSCGSDTLLMPELPDWVIMVDTMPCTMENTANINSSPYVTAPLATLAVEYNVQFLTRNL